jgi:hypothetical protein
MADQSAKQGSERLFIRPEPACGTSMGAAKRVIRYFLSGLKQAKVLIQGPSAKKTRELLNLNRAVTMDGRTTHKTLPPKRTPLQTGSG